DGGVSRGARLRPGAQVSRQFRAAKGRGAEKADPGRSQPVGMALEQPLERGRAGAMGAKVDGDLGRRAHAPPPSRVSTASPGSVGAKATRSLRNAAASAASVA